MVSRVKSFFMVVVWRGVILCGSLFVLSGFGVALVQAFQWLKSNQWKEMTIFTALENYLALPWLTHPQDWVGLHHLAVPALKALPLSAFLLGIGLVVLLFGKAKLANCPRVLSQKTVPDEE